MLGISPSSIVSAIPRSGHCLRIAAALTSVQKDSSSFGLTSSVSSSVQCTIQLSCSERDRFRLMFCSLGVTFFPLFVSPIQSCKVLHQYLDLKVFSTLLLSNFHKGLI